MPFTLHQIQHIIGLYLNEGYSTHRLAELFKVGHKKISQILRENNIEMKKRGGQINIGNSNEIEKTKVKKYVSENKDLAAKCKKTNVIINDPNNLSGKLTRHIIETYGDVNIPTNTYQRKKYEQLNGMKWYEEYFDIIELDEKPKRKCGLCNWETNDIDNKSGCFTSHIESSHNIGIDKYLTQFPNDIKYHIGYNKKLDRNSELLKEENFVICQLCNEKMKGISNTHLKNKHSISVEEYKLKFPNSKIVSESTSNILSEIIKETNINFQPTWTSKGETEIKEFIEGLGFEVYKGKNRKLLEGKEISWMDDFGNARYNELVWGMILKFQQFWALSKPELIFTEEFTYSDVHKYAGTADCVCKINGETWLIDFKTSNSLHKQYDLQLAAYAKSIEEAKGIKIDRTGILWLKAATRGEDKSGKKFQGKGWELKPIDKIEDNFELFKLIYKK